ncbi:hypothetical protein B0T19DRAFT_227347 [Cercophora scortea]|uniref:SUN domain-containing protein n=1 Tax=Cercophora scortea TaxID=314031 RepID=A0AAE0M9D7_9PEZI|nr:hypothetical protein B0T19DRAFT_227347 [Cercophora scortea]
MPPKRTTRKTATTASAAASPSPAPRRTPRRRQESVNAEAVRTPMPTKYSTSYGAPMSQLPNRMSNVAAGSLASATADLFAIVALDNQKAAEERRKAKAAREAAAFEAAKRAGKNPQPPPQLPPEDSGSEGERSRKRKRDEADAQAEREAAEREQKRREELAEALRRDEEDRLLAEKAARDKENAAKTARGRTEREQKRKEELAEALRRDEEERLLAEKAARDKAAADKAAREKAAADKAAREKAAREKAAREKAAAERAARQKAAEEKAAQELAAAERLARQRAAAEKAAEEQAAAEEAAQQQAAIEKMAREQAAAEKVARQKAAAERAAREKAEQRRAEEERLARAQEAEEARLREEERAEMERAARAEAAAERRRRAEAEKAAREEEAGAQAEIDARQQRPRSEEVHSDNTQEGSTYVHYPLLLQHGRANSLPPITPPPPLKERPILSAPLSSRSFVEEGGVYAAADVRTPSEPLVRRQPHRAPPDVNVSWGSEPTAADDQPPSRFVPILPKPGPVRPRPTSQYTSTRPPRVSKHHTHETPPRRTSENPLFPEVKSRFKWPSLSIPWSILFWALGVLLAILAIIAIRQVSTASSVDIFDGAGRSWWFGSKPSGVLTDDQYRNLKTFMEDKTTATSAAVKNIESILPKVVHVQKDGKGGKVLVDDQFWYAMKDRIQRDKDIYTLDANSDISNLQWKAIGDRFKKLGLVESIMDEKLPSSWNLWWKNNERKVTETMKKKLGGVGGQTGGKDQAGLQDDVITREEFLDLLEETMAEQKKDIDAQLESRLQTLLDKASKATSEAGGMTKPEIAKLVNQIVKKAVANARLESAAHSKIADSFDNELRSQVNHFGPGNSAVVERYHSSPTWITEPPFGSPEWHQQRNGPKFIPAPEMALTSWSDAGECWCAGTKKSNKTSKPAEIAVKLASFVIPQHLVLEHIRPSATNDPGAMPKHVEIWANYPDTATRERVSSLMAVTFPDAARENPLLIGLRYVKIGQFTYKHPGDERGVYVHRLSQELTNIDAATDLVMVRALTNHGAEDHTCFYRTRLYGDVVEDAAPATPDARGRFGFNWASF